MPRPSLTQLDAQRHAITQRALAGTSANDILSWLRSEGITTSLTSLKRRLKEWREADSLPIGQLSSNNDAVQQAVLEFFVQQNQNNRSSGRKDYLPSDQEIRDALGDRYGYRLSCRQIREVRLRHQIRRRAKRLTSRVAEGLVEAVVARCTAGSATITTTGGENGHESEKGEFELPKDDELVIEMRRAGFETSEREVRAIRHRHGIKHACRGANRYGQHRAVLHDTPSVESGGAEDEEGEEADENSEVEMQPASKLVQDRHFTVVKLDAEATALIRRIAKPITRLVYDTVGAGLRRVREPKVVADIARDLLGNLNVGPSSCTVTSVYISNHYIVPDAIFGIWVIPLVVHVESERVDDEEEEEEQFVDELFSSTGNHFIDDHAVRIGQAIYLTKPAAVHTRLTALILSR